MKKSILATLIATTSLSVFANPQDLSVDSQGNPTGAAIGDYSEANYTGYRVTHHMTNMLEHIDEFGLNVFDHSDIADHNSFVITPALDHLYSKALVDLRNGPVVIETAQRDERYSSLHIFDSEHYTRYAEITPKEGGKFLLKHKDFKGELPSGDYDDVITVGDDFSFVFIRTQTFDFTDKGMADEIRRQNKIVPMVKAQEVAIPSEMEREDPRNVIKWTIDHSSGYSDTSGYMQKAANNYDVDVHKSTFAHLAQFIAEGGVKGNPGMFEAHDDKDGGTNKVRAAGTLLGHLGFPVYHAYYENVNFNPETNKPLIGGDDFTVTIPHDHGLDQFWSVTRYSSDTYLPLDPKTIGGETTQVYNAFNTQPDENGEITITFSTKNPNNGTYWMPVVEGEGYYSVFRYYGANEKLNGKTAFDIIYGDSELAEEFQSVKFGKSL